MSAARSILRDLVWLAVVGVLIWLFPKIVLAVEGVCGLATLALFLVERGVAREW